MCSSNFLFRLANKKHKFFINNLIIPIIIVVFCQGNPNGREKSCAVDPLPYIWQHKIGDIQRGWLIIEF